MIKKFHFGFLIPESKADAFVKRIRKDFTERGIGKYLSHRIDKITNDENIEGGKGDCVDVGIDFDCEIGSHDSLAVFKLADEAHHTFLPIALSLELPQKKRSHWNYPLIVVCGHAYW